MQTDSVRWLSTRTIDFESYRREAHALREQAKAEFFGSAGRTVVPLIRSRGDRHCFHFRLTPDVSCAGRSRGVQRDRRAG